MYGLVRDLLSLQSICLDQTIIIYIYVSRFSGFIPFNHTSGLESLQREPREVARYGEKKGDESWSGGMTWSRVNKSPLLATCVRAHIMACLERADSSTTTITRFLFFIIQLDAPASPPPLMWIPPSISGVTLNFSSAAAGLLRLLWASFPVSCPAWDESEEIGVAVLNDFIYSSVWTEAEKWSVPVMDWCCIAS